MQYFEVMTYDCLKASTSISHFLHDKYIIVKHRVVPFPAVVLPMEKQLIVEEAHALPTHDLLPQRLMLQQLEHVQTHRVLQVPAQQSTSIQLSCNGAVPVKYVSRNPHVITL